jgi:hypothetical protein
LRDIIPFIGLVLGECRFVPLEPKAPQPTSDFHAETLKVSPGMIPQPEKRVHVAAFGRPLRLKGLRSGSWQILAHLGHKFFKPARNLIHRDRP